MVVKRRAYVTSDGVKVKVDEELKLPKDKWLPMVLELACALGVSSEFPNSHRLFQRWTDIDITEKTFSNNRNGKLFKSFFSIKKKKPRFN